MPHIRICLPPLLAMMLAACVPGFALISEEQEAQIGHQVHEQVVQEFQVLDSPEMVDYLRTLTAELVEHQEETPEDFEVFLVVDPTVNAFAVPGGNIYIHSGLVEAAGNESDLAGVLAHEMGHVIERHGAEQLTRMFGLELLAAVALGQDPGILEQLGAQVGGTTVLLAYSRSAEREADDIAVKYTHAAGIDPRGLVRFFEFLAAQEPDTPGVLTWLRTHPLTTDRIKRAERLIQTLPARPVREDSAAFREYQQRVAQRISAVEAGEDVPELRTVRIPLEEVLGQDH